MKSLVIFGGSGFIGQHFASYSLKNGYVQQVVLADLKPPEEHAAFNFVKDFIVSGKVRYVPLDVRQPIELEDFETDRIDLIANFAAVHREPGHEPHEYFETNLLGAENVCAFAEQVGCEDIIFTSSISPYGPTETIKSEESIPVPESAYGSSKLAAEYIHKGWRNKDVKNRRLLIVRPGVVFGPGEGGNVSRLIKALKKGYFVFAGNRETRKAGAYIKELCRSIWWLREIVAVRGPNSVTFNMTMNPGPSIQEYVKAIQEVSGRRRPVPSIPLFALVFFARVVELLTVPFGISQPINVVRVCKLVRSNNIIPGVLIKEGYPYHYTLVEALKEWKKDMPEEW